MEINEASEAARERWKDTPTFEAIWDGIKGWDIERTPQQGYSGANGTDVGTICLALEEAGYTPSTLETLSDLEIHGPHDED